MVLIFSGFVVNVLHALIIVILHCIIETKSLKLYCILVRVSLIQHSTSNVDQKKWF